MASVRPYAAPRGATDVNAMLQNDVVPGTRGTIFPAAQYTDGQYHLAWPGLIAQPLESFNAMSPQNSVEDNSRLAFDVAGGAMTGGLAAGMAGAGERAGVNLGDHAMARYLDWKHPNAEAAYTPYSIGAEGRPGQVRMDFNYPHQRYEINPQDAGQVPYGLQADLGATPPYANDYDSWDALTGLQGQQRDLAALRGQADAMKRDLFRIKHRVIDGDLNAGGFGIGQKLRNMILGAPDDMAGAVPEGAVAANGIKHFANSPTGSSVPLAFNDYEDQPRNAMVRQY